MKKSITLFFLLPLIAISGCSVNYFKDEKPTKCKGMSEVDSEFALQGSPIEIVTLRTSKNIPENWAVVDRIFIKDMNTGKVTIRSNRSDMSTKPYVYFPDKGSDPVMKMLASKESIKTYSKYIDLKECKIKSR